MRSMRSMHWFNASRFMWSLNHSLNQIHRCLCDSSSRPGDLCFFFPLGSSSERPTGKAVLWLILLLPEIHIPTRMLRARLPFQLTFHHDFMSTCDGSRFFFKHRLGPKVFLEDYSRVTWSHLFQSLSCLSIRRDDPVTRPQGLADHQVTWNPGTVTAMKPPRIERIERNAKRSTDSRRSRTRCEVQKIAKLALRACARPWHMVTRFSF
jgi:hypothetical protein